MRQKNYLFYVSHNYAYEILRPLQEVIRRRGDRVAWFLAGQEIDDRCVKDEYCIPTVDDVIDFNPIACFVPGNHVPPFIPGLKVQVFHGLEWKKKGHFGIRGCFDLYCTHGPITTNRFQSLKQEHGHFDVAETGWPKIDALYHAKAESFSVEDKPIVLYAPTFSPKLTSAACLIDEIARISAISDFYWVVKFHPKMEQRWIDKYKSLQSEYLTVVDMENVGGLLRAAQVLLSDTSSIIGEFAILGKPAITFRNSLPDEYVIDIDNPDLLQLTLENCLVKQPTAADPLITRYVGQLHPTFDGKSSERVLSATDDLIARGTSHLRAKPRNHIRNLKMRRMLRYWR